MALGWIELKSSIRGGVKVLDCQGVCVCVLYIYILCIIYIYTFIIRGYSEYITNTMIHGWVLKFDPEMCLIPSGVIKFLAGTASSTGGVSSHI